MNSPMGSMNRRLHRSTTFRDNEADALKALQADYEILQDKYAQLEQMLRSIPTSLVLTDRNGRIEYANDALKDRIHQPRDKDVTDRSIFEFTTPAGEKIFRELAGPAILSTGQWQGEIPLKRSDGTTRPFAAFGTMIRNDSGKPYFLLYNFEDIARQSDTEKALRENQKMLKTVIDSTKDCICIKDRNFRYVLVNPSLATFYDLPPEDILGKTDDEILNKEQAEKIRKMDVAVLEGQFLDYEIDFNVQGKVTSFNTIKFPIQDDSGQVCGIGMIARDLTERKRIMEELNRANQYLTDIIDFLPDPTFVVNPEGKVTFWNHGMEQMTGMPKEKVLGRKNVASHLYDEERPLLIDLIFKGERDAESKYEYIERLENDLICGETFVPFAYGRGAHLWGMAGPLRDKSGQVIGAIETVRDMTRLRESRQALIQSEARYRKLFESTSDAIILMRKDVFIDCNPSALELFKCTREEILGKCFHQVSPFLQPNGRNSREYAREKINRALNGDYPFFEWQLWTSGNILLETEISLCPIEIQGEALVLAIIRDVTERKMMKEELVKARKLKSIGILAGGIAHDLNNLFSAVIGNIFLAKNELHNPDKALKRLAEAEATGIQVKELTNRFITFSEGGEPLKTRQDLNEMVKTAMEDFSYESGIRWRLDLADPLPPIYADREQICQVIRHLLRNAVESMPEGGEISLSTGQVFLQAGQIPLLREGHYLRCIVKDQGIGIPFEHLEMIFDPYFTTKPMGNAKGSGLGLAICHSIMKKHDGAITCASQRGSGSTFTLYLPAAGAKNGINGGKPSDMAAKPRHRVLVMDDNEAIREVTGQLLRHLGYHVELAADGEEAIEKYKQARQSEKPFDVLLLDLTIRGGKGGYETIQTLRAIDPEVKAIVVSGYIHDPILESWRDYGFCAALTKPFTVGELDKTLIQTLTQSETSSGKTPDISL